MEEERGKERERDSLEKTISSDEEKYSFALIIPLCDKRIVHRAANHQSFLSYTSGCSSRSPLATLDSRLLKYSRIRVARRNFPSIHLSVPFSSLWASIFQISIRSILSSKNRGPSKATITVWIPNGEHPHPKIVHSSNIHMHICRGNACSTRRKAFLDPWPTASRPLPYFESMLVPKSRWIFLFLQNIEESMEIFFSISLDN